MDHDGVMAGHDGSRRDHMNILFYLEHSVGQESLIA